MEDDWDLVDMDEKWFWHEWMTGEVNDLDELEYETKRRRLENRINRPVSLPAVSVSFLAGPRSEWELLAFVLRELLHLIEGPRSGDKPR